MDAAPQHLETRLFARLRAWLLGYDVFISYKRDDALGYALAVENFLRTKDVACFRDYHEIAPSEDFPKRIERALRRSRLLLVIGSALAVDPVAGTWVRREIEYFCRHRSRVVVVNIGDCVTRDTWSDLKDKPWIIESARSLQPPTPSQPVLDAIEAERHFVRRNTVARWIVAAAMVTVATLAGAALWSGGRARENARISQAQQLVAGADALRATDPAALDKSVRQSLAAQRILRSITTSAPLRAALDVLPPLLADIQTSCDAQKASVDPSHHLLALANILHVCVIDLIGQKQVLAAPVDLHAWVDGILFLKDGVLLASFSGLGSNNSSLRIYRGPHWTVAGTQDFPGRISLLASSGNHHWIAAGTKDGHVAVAPVDGDSIPMFSRSRR